MGHIGAITHLLTPIIETSWDIQVVRDELKRGVSNSLGGLGFLHLRPRSVLQGTRHCTWRCMVASVWGNGSMKKKRYGDLSKIMSRYEFEIKKEGETCGQKKWSKQCRASFRLGVIAVFLEVVLRHFAGGFNPKVSHGTHDARVFTKRLVETNPIWSKLSPCRRTENPQKVA